MRKIHYFYHILYAYVYIYIVIFLHRVCFLLLRGMYASQTEMSSSNEDAFESFSDDSRCDRDFNYVEAIAEAQQRKDSQHFRIGKPFAHERESKKPDVDTVVEANESISMGADKMEDNEQMTVRSKQKKRRKKQATVRCYVCKKPTWRIISHLQDAHDVPELTAKEYRWRRPTKGPQNKCTICGVTRVRLARHLKRKHNVSSEDTTRLQYLEAMGDSYPRLQVKTDKLLVAKSSSAAIPKVYTPALFSKRFDFIWSEYAEHLRRRIFTNVRSIDESVTRKIREAIFVIQLVDRRGDLQKLFAETNDNDVTSGDRFERLAFARITDELRCTTNVASSWANRLRSLIRFLNYLLVYKQSVLLELGISIQQVQNVMERTKEFKSFAEKAKSSRTNTIRHEQMSQTFERKRSVEQIRKDFDDALSHNNISSWVLQARDLLMCLLVDTNASRPGPIINMTLQEFENRTLRVKEDIWVISVAAHKTCSQFGPATVFFNPRDMERLERYVIEARPMLSFNEPDNFVFITKDTVVTDNAVPHKRGGRQLTSSAFCKIQKKVLGYTTTLKRKKDSVKFRDSKAEKNVTELMLHSHETHKRNYCGTATLEQRLTGFTTINQPELCISSSEGDDLPVSSTSKLPDNNHIVIEHEYTSSDHLPTDTTSQRHANSAQFQETILTTEDGMSLLKPSEIPSELLSWYEPATEDLPDYAIRDIRRWTKQDQLCLHKFLGAYRGKDKVKSLKTVDITQVLSFFPEFKLRMINYTTKQIRDKLKGWPS